MQHTPAPRPRPAADPGAFFATAHARSVTGKPAFSWNRLSRSSPAGFSQLFAMPSLERADLVREGAPAVMVHVIAREMDTTKDRVVRIMGLPRATITRKIVNEANLSADESEHLVGLAKLIGQVETIVEGTGAPKGFSAARWFGEWIAQPLPALGGRRAEDLLDTADGRELVSRLLAQMQSGAYA